MSKKKKGIRKTITLFGFIKFSYRRTARISDYLRRSYSQDGEDVMLSAFYDGQARRNGFYVDIGALHPHRFSNTQLFYERGWRGINIDATPGCMELFNKHRPKDINVEAVISDKIEEITYYLFDEPGLNNFSKLRCEHLAELGIIAEAEVRLKTQRINDILSAHLPENTTIDFMNIDIEGVEFAIISGLDFTRFAPKYFLIEELDYVDNDFFEYQHSATYKFLYDKGYRVVGKTLRTVIFKKTATIV